MQIKEKEIKSFIKDDPEKSFDDDSKKNRKFWLICNGILVIFFERQIFKLAIYQTKVAQETCPDHHKRNRHVFFFIVGLWLLCVSPWIIPLRLECKLAMWWKFF